MYSHIIILMQFIFCNPFTLEFDEMHVVARTTLIVVDYPYDNVDGFRAVTAHSHSWNCAVDGFGSLSNESPCIMVGLGRDFVDTVVAPCFRLADTLC